MRTTFLLAGVLALACARDEASIRCCPGAAIVDRDDPIPGDPSLRTGTLPNGLRYYVRYLNTAAQRTELRLVVDAGSVLEEEDQRGLAHAVEHLAIRGSKRFPRRSVEDYIESIGMRRGEGVNGSTWFDETEYRMTLPSDRSGALDTAIAMMAGIAAEAEFTPGEEGPEAGVLMEEWRSGRDAVQRIADARQAFIFAGTPYANRSPIGDTAVLRRFDMAAMRRFYETWYRPDLMAVTLVGEFDTDAAVKMIERHFGAIPKPASPPAARSRPGPPRVDSLRAAIVADDEATTTRVALWFPREPRLIKSLEDYRQSLIRWVWMEILRSRLEDAALHPGSGVNRVTVESRVLARPLRAYIITASTPSGQATEGLATLTSEVQRLARSSPTEAEVNETSRRIFAGVVSAHEDGENLDDITTELIDFFLHDNAPVTRALAHDLSRDLLPTIYARDVAAFARTISVDSSPAIIFASASSNDPIVSQPPDSLIRAARAIAATPRVGIADTSRPVLTSPTPPAGRIISEGRNRSAGAYTWRLSNGMRVFLKPSSYSYDEVLIRIVAPGGASLATDSTYPSAYLSDAIIEETGVGEFSGPRLARWLEGTSISVSPYVADDAIQLEASATPDDLEPMLKLLHLYVTSPRRDTVAFRRYKDRVRESFLLRKRDPDAVFADTLAALMEGHHRRSYRASVDFLDQVRLDDALAFWAARFSNGAGIRVVIAGDFTLDTLRPLVERYLGSIPAGGVELPRDVGARFPNGRVTRVIRSGRERARAAITLSGSYAPTDNVNRSISAVEELLEHALGNEIRERLGGSYSVNASAKIDLVPPVRYSLTVDFEADPARIDDLSRIAVAEIERLRNKGPTEAEFQAIKSARVRDYDSNLKTNEFWVSELSSHARWGWPIATIATHRQQAEAMTIDDLRAACTEFLRGENVLKLTMLPIR